MELKSSKFVDPVYQLPPELELECLRTRTEWIKTARPNQLTPDATSEDWDVWLLMAGRGFGKTKTGAEDLWYYGFENPGTRLAVIAPTAGDVRDTCFEGVSGLMNVIPSGFIESYHSSLSEITLKNGTNIKGFSVEKPDRLRGPQFHRAWCDELAAWDKNVAVDAWDMLMFGLRLGEHPQVVATTTPKPVELVHRLVNNPRTKITRGTTYENRAHLSRVFFESIKVYEGTTIGRQELYGELIDLEEQGIYKRSWFKLWGRKKPLPYFDLVMQSYDTAFTEKTSNDPTGSITLGIWKPQDSNVYNVMLIDAWTDHLKYPDLKSRIKEEYECLYGAGDTKPTVVLIENKGSGQDIINDLISDTQIPLFSYNPGRADKTQRAHAVSYIPCNGLMWVPESEINRGKPRDWVEPFLHQLCAYPNVKHDEYVDCLSQALAFLRDQSWFTLHKDEDEEYVDMPRNSWYHKDKNFYLE